MIVGVLKEPISGEKRVAATPESVKQLIGKGLKVSRTPRETDLPVTIFPRRE
jgi:alanine dehydrogenase